MSNRIPLPPPALTQHPSGNVYFSPQQMQKYADEVRAQALEDAAQCADGQNNYIVGADIRALKDQP